MKRQSWQKFKKMKEGHHANMMS